MNPDQVLDQIIEANPKPAEGQVPGTVLTRAALLVELDRRSGDMQTQDKPAGQKTNPTKPTRPSGPRRLVPALAGAAAVIVALVIGVVALSGDQEPASKYADAAAGGEPAAIFGLFVESYRTGDVEGALTYVDADLGEGGSSFGRDFQVVDFAAWMGGLIEFEGALYGRTEPGASECGGPDESGWVTCTFTEAPDGALAAAGFSETTWRGKVSDGRIATLEFPGLTDGDVFALSVDESFQGPLGAYAAEIDPEGMAAQCDIAGSLERDEARNLPVVYNQQCGAFLAGFLDDYQATLG